MRHIEGRNHDVVYAQSVSQENLFDLDRHEYHRYASTTIGWTEAVIVLSAKNCAYAAPNGKVCLARKLVNRFISPV